jgi:phosphatidylglycerol:prolipoprotein diacylglycerol transferase
VFPNGDPLARHPSQLYEALLEKVLCYLPCSGSWVYSSKPRPVMATSGLALFLYGCFRFFVEFFRMPDAQLGFLALNWVTMGQILSTPMIFMGAVLFYYAYKK